MTKTTVENAAFYIKVAEIVANVFKKSDVPGDPSHPTFSELTTEKEASQHIIDNFSRYKAPEGETLERSIRNMLNPFLGKKSMEHYIANEAKKNNDREGGEQPKPREIIRSRYHNR
ncbi:MAG: hypothetical protein ACTSXQ_03425 [Alphaproteobacteria bacterium]